MPQLFVFRSQAVADAQRQGHKNFRTAIHEDTGMWKSWYEPGESPAEGWQHFDFVNHVETAWDRSVTPPRKFGVVVVTCRLDEIPPADFDELFRLGIQIEPLTPSLFRGSEGDGTKASRRSSTGSSTRARSDVESPVKVVWRIADEMVGAERKDVIAACVAAGVNKATASTQFYRWQKAKEPK